MNIYYSLNINNLLQDHQPMIKNTIVLKLQYYVLFKTLLISNDLV